MCIGGTRTIAMAAGVLPREYKNRPVTVTGTQTGVENPKDTAKATESLKIQRQKEEGTYVDPNLTTTEKLTNKGGSNQRAAKNRRKNLAKAQANARARKAQRSRPKGAHGGASDIRLKENIKQIGLSELGYKIYEFNYKNDATRYRGAMAQDVMTKLPEAIGVKDGFLYVDYDMIDINMEVI